MKINFRKRIKQFMAQIENERKRISNTIGRKETIVID